MRTRRSQSSSDPAVSHRPVLLHEVIDSLAIQKDDVVLDATLGGAGHAREIVARLGAKGSFIGFDLDADAIERARHALAHVAPAVHLIESNFRNMSEQLATRGITVITKALFDLGWSTQQLDSGRGFSFLTDEPLLMTYSREPQFVHAATIVNEWKEESIADIIFGFGGERYSRRIAKAIVEERQRKPFSTSRELAQCVASAVPVFYRRGKLHPATRTFQALRIAVNDELGALDQGVRSAWQLLAAEGRIAVITFHSLEDRAVKRLFAEFEHSGQGLRINKKPLVATRDEIASNPRARSAKLRVIIKKFQYDEKINSNKQT